MNDKQEKHTPPLCVDCEHYRLDMRPGELSAKCARKVGSYYNFNYVDGRHCINSEPVPCVYERHAGYIISGCSDQSSAICGRQGRYFNPRKGDMVVIQPPPMPNCKPPRGVTGRVITTAVTHSPGLCSFFKNLIRRKPQSQVDDWPPEAPPTEEMLDEGYVYIGRAPFADIGAQHAQKFLGRALDHCEGIWRAGNLGGSSVGTHYAAKPKSLSSAQIGHLKKKGIKL